MSKKEDKQPPPPPPPPKIRNIKGGYENDLKTDRLLGVVKRKPGNLK